MREHLPARLSRERASACACTWAAGGRAGTPNTRTQAPVRTQPPATARGDHLAFYLRRMDRWPTACRAAQTRTGSPHTHAPWRRPAPPAPRRQHDASQPAPTVWVTSACSDTRLMPLYSRSLRFWSATNSLGSPSPVTSQSLGVRRGADGGGARAVGEICVQCTAPGAGQLRPTGAARSRPRAGGRRCGGVDAHRMQLGVVWIAATGSWCASSHTAIAPNQTTRKKMWPTNTNDEKKMSRTPESPHHGNGRRYNM